MRVGYVRTSTTNQKLDIQINQINDYGVDILFQEQVSGKDINREEFQKMISYVREGDEIVVSSLDRLGRNYEDIKNTLFDLRSRGIKFIILDAPFLNFNTGNKTLDLAMSDMFILLLGYIAENEREKILTRQRHGIEIAKKKGHYRGRPVKYHEFSKNPKDRFIYNSVKKLLEQNESIRNISKSIGIPKSTVADISKRLNNETF